MVIEMVIVIKLVFRQHDDGNHFGYGGDDCYGSEDINSTYGYFHMAPVIRGNSEGECDFTKNTVMSLCLYYM